MRILVLGAGGVGGYFGGRLLQSGADVTFLVRPARKERIDAGGLSVKTPDGGFTLKAPTLLAAQAALQPWDLAILSCKAYDLDDAIAALVPVVGPNTAVLPLLNGMNHLDRLNETFGAGRVLGGLCAISATLGPDGEVVQLTPLHALAFGEQAGGSSPRADAFAAILAKAAFDGRRSDVIIQEMWEKWAFLSTLAATTCLMRANVGEIVSSGGADFILALLEEVRAIAAANGHAQRPAAFEQAKGLLTGPDQVLAASMLRDLEKGGPVEADHIIGDLLARGEKLGVKAPLLTVAYLHLRAFAKRRERRGQL